MSKLKNKLNTSVAGMGMAGAMLMSGAGLFNIEAIILEVTGIQVPRWFALTLIGIGGVAAVVSACASMGIAIPATAAALIAAAGNAAA